MKFFYCLLPLAIAVFLSCGPQYYDRIRTFPDEISGSKKMTLACFVRPDRKFTGVRFGIFVFEKMITDQGNSVSLAAQFDRNRATEPMDSILVFVIDETRFSLPLLNRKTTEHSRSSTNVSGSITAGSGNVQSQPIFDEWFEDRSKTLIPSNLLVAFSRATKVRILTRSGDQPVSMMFSRQNVQNIQTLLKK